MPVPFRSLSIGLMLIAACTPAPQTTGSTDEPLTRESVLGIVAGVRRIATPEGIDTTVALEIDGTRQYLAIRGLNRANPVLLMIHGGPASPMMPTSWAWQKPWEDFFTVVQWDQRGAGKNYRLADTTADPGPWTIDRIVEDGAEVIRYLQRTLGKEKVVVVGYSWGSMVGVHLAARYPELLHAYVGVGQAVSIRGEGYLYSRLMELARLHGNDSAVAALEALAPYPGPTGAPPIERALAVRQWAGRFNGGWYGHPSLDTFGRMGLLAQEYDDEDLAVQGQAGRYGGGGLYQTMVEQDLSTLGPFQIPMFFFQGRYDLYTPFVIARRFAESVKAPLVRFIPFERSAHFVMLEEPGRFLVTLVREVLPLTGEAAAFAVGPDAPQ